MCGCGYGCRCVFSLHICWMSSNRKRIKTVLIKRNWIALTYHIRKWMNEQWALCVVRFFFVAFCMWAIMSLRSRVLICWSYFNWFPLKASHVFHSIPSFKNASSWILKALRYRCTYNKWRNLMQPSWIMMNRV